MTTEPTEAELTNEGLGRRQRARRARPAVHDRPGAVHRQVAASTLRWVVDGEVQKTVDVRFGGSSTTPTREGVFSVYMQEPRPRLERSTTRSMPFAMFFSGGQAVHYSPDFAAVGYNGASHGCVNVRDYDGIAWLFDQVAGRRQGHRLLVVS